MFKADSSAIESLKKKIEDYRASIAKIPNLTDSMVLLGIAFGGTGIAHLVAESVGPWFQQHQGIFKPVQPSVTGFKLFLAYCGCH